MKLFYTPGGCYLSPYIVACEAELTLALVQVDLRAQRTADGRDFQAINPKGYVPALELDDGQILTENPVVAQYLADRNPERGLAPAEGTMARYRLQEILSYISSELHKTYSPLFKSSTSPGMREEREAHLRRRYRLIEDHLSGSPYLLGDRFTVADAYLFTVTRWASRLNVDLSMFPGILDFQDRIAQRRAVKRALRAESSGC